MLKKVILLIGISLCYLFCFAQNESLLFKRIDSGDGLSKNTISSIIQDTDNFIWIGTSNGLNRFDGIEFKVFKHNPSDASSIPSNEIKCVFQSKFGDIWIGTQSGGVFKYLPSKDKFKEFSFFLSQKSKTGSINAVVEHKNGDIWMVSDDAIMQHSKDKFLIYEPNYVKQIRTLVEKSATELWVVCNKAIYLFDTEKKQIIKDQKISFEDNTEIRFINKTSEGKWLIGTSTGAYLYTQNKLAKITSLQNIRVNCMATDLKGNSWLGTNAGLFQFNKNFSSFNHFTYDPTNFNSISSNDITTLLINRTGILFVGTNFSGLNICNTNKNNFQKFTLQSDKFQTSTLNNIKAIAQDENGGFMIGSADLGLYFAKNLNSTSQSNFKIIIPNLHVLTVYKSTDHHYWVGSIDPNRGIIKINKEGKLIYNYSNFINQKYKLSTTRGYCFLQTGPREMWVGTNGDGLFRILLDELSVPLSVDRISTKGDAKKTLSSDQILCLQMVNNKLWIGTKNGLNILDVKTRYVKKIFHQPNNNQSIASDKINNIFKDSSHKLWVGTAGGGLNLFIKDSLGKALFKRYTETEGLSNNIVLGISEDHHKNLWISTSYGLNRLSMATGKFNNYYFDDGLSSSEFRHNAVYKDQKGLMYFGTIKGITILDPSNIKEDLFPPSVKIIDFTLFNKKVKIDEPINGRVVFTKDLRNNSSIILSYKENIFGFRFSALHFASPKFNKYKYRLAGFNEDWIDTDVNERGATYTNLPAGDYTFQVKASNQYNIWSKPISVNVRILPAPWVTWWAKLIYLSIFFSLVLLAYKIFQTRQSYKTQLAFEKNQQEIIKQVNKSKLNFFTNISHEFRTPLTLILSPLAKIINEEEKTSSYYNIHHVIYRNAERLYHLIEQLMDFRELEDGIMKFNPQHADIVMCIANTVKSFENYAQQQKIQLIFTSLEKEIKMDFDKQKVENMIYNLLSNAFNFTPENGYIEVIVSSNLNEVNIEVFDNGKIITAKEQDKVFEKYYTVPGDKPITKKGIGIGLALTKELVELHDGYIALTSEEGIGTSFKITMPLHQTGDYRFNPNSEFLDISSIDLEKTPEIAPYTTTEKPVVVVIEDFIDLREFIRESLSKNYVVYTADNGKDGLQLVEDVLPDLVVSDIVMPQLDGLSVCYRIKSNALTAHIPVLLLTDRTSVEDTINGVKTGADDYVPKPFNMDLLIAKCQNLILIRRKLSEIFRAQMSEPTSEIEAISYNEFTAKAIKLIEDNLSDTELGIDFLTDNLHMSRAQLYRKFKALSNQTVKEFIRLVRLKNAAILILENKLNISEICYETGFSSHSYFSKCFKETYGVTPKNYAVEHSKKVNQ
jgi:signal transduction histidine kinase/ligand-binding sensor domain-containing protein/DNA-binding response OmpR family regulator